MLTAQELLHLESIGGGRYRSRHNLDNGVDAIFGGHLLALSLAAVQREVLTWPAHSLSGYFLSAGKIEAPLYLSVEQVNESRRFTTRRVLASQLGRPVFEMLCSFHDAEPGLAYQPIAELAVPAPESLPTLPDFARTNAALIPPEILRHYTRPFPIEMRLVDSASVLTGAATTHRDLWFRVPSAELMESPSDHQCLLALMSDYWLASSAASLEPDAERRSRLKIASLNHSLWLHAPARADNWLLYRTETIWAGNGRALARGQIYDRDFRLVASAVQEFLLRQLSV